MANLVHIDIIILSYAKNEKLKALTRQTIQTLLASEDPEKISFNIVVIESNKALKPFQFEHTQTVYPEGDFGFNKFLNIGIRATSNDYLCLCNNDLIFHSLWATEMLKIMAEDIRVQSVSPFCPGFKPHLALDSKRRMIVGKKSNLFNGILTGWCIFVKRTLIDTIGYFDEQFDFWYADNDYGRTLLKHKVKHVLAVHAKVEHLANMSHAALSDDLLDQFTYGQKDIFEAKWGKEKKPVKQRVKTRLKTFMSAWKK